MAANSSHADSSRNLGLRIAEHHCLPSSCENNSGTARESSQVSDKLGCNRPGWVNMDNVSVSS